MSSSELKGKDKEDYDEFFKMLHGFFHNIKKEGKINPNFEKTKEEINKRIFYFDEIRKVTDKLDWILFDRKGERINEFLTDVKKHDFSKNHFMQIYSTFLIFNMLIFYSNAEGLFLTMLKGAKYGNNKEDQISGTEPLGKLLLKIFKLDTKHKLNEEIIRNILDHKIRNALAHGWFRIEKNQLVYFEESLESVPIIMDEVELLGRIIHLKHFGMALSHIVLSGDWENK